MARKPKSLLAYHWLLFLVAAMWLVEMVNLIADHQFCRYGIFPRSPHGLVGIPFSPFLHAGVGHLVLNTGPLIVLGGLILFHGRQSFVRATIFIVLTGGLALWLVGRPAYHVGSSALIFGYFGYLLAKGLFDRRFQSFFLSLVTVLAYGGLFWGLLPTLPHVSWEGHVCGFAAGILVARLERRKGR
jgi:membrane associated rhomboid family serine protease